MIKQLIILFSLTFIALGLGSCDKSEPTKETPILELVHSYAIDVEEPSGLDLSDNNTKLWTVGDSRSKMYQLDLTGNILKEISVPGSNLEGITYDFNDNTLWVVLESAGEILQLDTLGNELQRLSIAGVRDGGGLEGITINQNDDHIFLLKEKNPSVLLELDTAFEVVQYKRISTAQDYSGMDYDSIRDELWMVSDQNKEVLRYDLAGKILESYPIQVKKAEGITINREQNILYIVSDSADSLYIYQFNDI